jgi:hypothetical protein
MTHIVSGRSLGADRLRDGEGEKGSIDAIEVAGDRRELVRIRERRIILEEKAHM